MKPKKILVRGVNWLGDAVMSTPALQRLREATPDAQITLLTRDKLAELWQDHPALDEVMTFASEENVFRIGGRLRKKHFDLALVLPNSPRSALEVFLGRIPERVGYKRAWRNCFLTRRIPLRAELVPMHKRSVKEITRLIQSPVVTPLPPAKAHHLYQYLHLVGALGAQAEPLPPHIALSAAEVASIQARFQFAKEPDDRPFLFGLNPGAEYGPAKRWAPDNFILAARALQRQINCHWWVFGGKGDEELASRITSAIQVQGKGQFGGAQCLAGMTTLRELCAALKACDLLLTNDTGPMHLAAAVGTRVVALFGSTSPELTAPGLPGQAKHSLLKSAVPCAPCFRRECPIDFRCMHGISVERVIAAVLDAAKR